MHKNLLSSGLIAGALAGLAVALLQFWLVQPLIEEAELYETGVLSLFEGADHGSTAHSDAGTEAHGHTPAAPSEGLALARHALTVGSLLVTWCGFALVLAGAMALAARLAGGATAAPMLWSVAGFAAFHAAPSLGLPPELPGMIAADLEARQAWWVLTAAVTLVGGGLLIAAPSPALRAGAVVLIALPHLIGAPHLDEVFTPTVPSELVASYVARVLGIGLAGWLVLGAALHRLLGEAARA